MCGDTGIRRVHRNIDAGRARGISSAVQGTGSRAGQSRFRSEAGSCSSRMSHKQPPRLSQKTQTEEIGGGGGGHYRAEARSRI